MEAGETESVALTACTSSMRSRQVSWASAHREIPTVSERIISSACISADLTHATSLTRSTHAGQISGSWMRSALPAAAEVQLRQGSGAKRRLEAADNPCPLQRGQQRPMQLPFLGRRSKRPLARYADLHLAARLRAALRHRLQDGKEWQAPRAAGHALLLGGRALRQRVLQANGTGWREEPLGQSIRHGRQVGRRLVLALLTHRRVVWSAPSVRHHRQWTWRPSAPRL